LRFVVPLAEPLVVASDKAGEQARPDSRAQSGAQLGAQSASILKVLSDTPLSASEIAAVLGLETKTGAFKRTIKELLEQGLIEYTIPEKPNSRLQKYRLKKREV
ncbi:MAG: transcriptional regulator, partial [Deltaproteobacteria bacterium]|nr:transcriptional regulator [Deltaproteobacteria bacterium]